MKVIVLMDNLECNSMPPTGKNNLIITRKRLYQYQYHMVKGRKIDHQIHLLQKNQ